MANNQIVLWCEYSDDAVGTAQIHDRLAGQFEALAAHWTDGSEGARYLLKLAEVHRGRAEQAMKAPKPKAKRVRRVS
jgi:hypothetical protein